jgi:plasmid segregation protein ParM
MDKIKIIAGLDIGNGYVKGATKANDADNVNIDIPSCVAAVPNPTDLPATDIKNEIDNIFDRATITFDSPLVTGIHATTRAYLGRRGVESGKSITAFDIESHVSKANQPLSAVLVLSIIAGAALQNYYRTKNALPTETIQVEAKTALALPITEFKTYRDSFSEGFTKTTHIVCFHNFETPVRVEIKFSRVSVLAEGASAQIAIVSKGEKFMNALLQDVRSNGVKLDGITANDILGASGTLGIDIGEGTVNFPVFTGTHFNTDFSANISKGYGTVLENSLAPLQAANNVFHDRKSLGEFLQTAPSALKRRKYDSAMSVVNAESMTLVDAIVKEFTSILNKANGQIEVVYVYGGGASPLKEQLYPALIKASKSFSAGDEFPIMYLDSRYSRFLNREGLFQLAAR